MHSYKHTVNYYETDKMGITHHSNYVRFMEEARIDLLASIGWPYDRLEKEGIISPVVAVECRYKTPSTFADILDIKVRGAEFKGVKLKIEYKMTCNDKVVCEARSEHCFVNDKGMPIRLQKEFPDLYDCLIEHAQEDSGIIL